MVAPARSTLISREKIATQLRDCLRAARDDVLGIVVFGSFARDEPWHDVDVLVVVEKDPVSPVEHDEQVAALSQAVAWPPAVDILLYSQSDFRLNLAHHTPLFLDIAFDGQVLYDAGEIASSLEATRAEVMDRSIQRTPTGGWRFPVKHRVATPLSATTNQERTQSWLNEAAEDISSAETLLREAHYARCIYLCQQAVEKSVKAVLVCFGIFEHIHYVAKLLRSELGWQPIGQWEGHLETLAAASARLEPEVARSRYPGERHGKLWEPAKGYGEPQAITALADARESLRIARDFGALWFNPSGAETTPTE